MMPAALLLVGALVVTVEVKAQEGRGPPAARQMANIHPLMSSADLRQMQLDRQPSALPRATAGSAAAMAMALNAKDFGAVGDGQRDDTAALQAAISAAQKQNRALAVPAGNYSISSPLAVKHGEGSLRLFGESMYSTFISAAGNFTCGTTFLGQFECAVLHLPGEQTDLYPPWVENFGKTTTDHEISHINLQAANRAKHGLYAPLITRSRFVAIEVNGATAAGIMLGYGWCNYLLEVRVSSNTIGILLVNAANNVNVVNAIVEANYGAGIVLQAGYQVNLEGNVIEGNKGPAIVAGGMYALTVSSHYFESNNERRLYNMTFDDAPSQQLLITHVSRPIRACLHSRPQLILVACTACITHGKHSRIALTVQSVCFMRGYPDV